MSHGPIQLVAADLDGTLLDDDKTIADVTADAVRDLAMRGIRFVIASARPPRSVRHIYEQLRLDTLQVNYNGALIWDEPRKAAVEHSPLDGGLVLDIIHLARGVDERTLITCEILDRWHTDRLDNTYTTATGKLFGPDHIGPPEGFCDQPVTKLLLLGPPSMILRLGPMVLERFGGRINMVSTDPDMLQIMAKGVSKAAALRSLVKHYGIPLENVLAIGDGENDIEMLSECGHGAAVANAAPRLKAIADYIAPVPNSHGVLAILRHYGL